MITVCQSEWYHFRHKCPHNQHILKVSTLRHISSTDKRWIGVPNAQIRHVINDHIRNSSRAISRGYEDDFRGTHSLWRARQSRTRAI